jgi:hypothetical protein
MEPLTAPCPDSPKALLARELCLSEVSKNLEGELRLLESEREDCKTRNAGRSRRCTCSSSR